jgi:hypothetical protein
MADTSEAILLGNDTQVVDLYEAPPPCDYLGGLMYPAIKLLFSPITYPPPPLDFQMSSSNTTCTGWTALSRDLSLAAHESGNSIMCNGSQKSQQDMASSIVQQGHQLWN